MPLSEDEVSLGNEEFIVPEDPVEHECFKRRRQRHRSKPRQKKANPALETTTPRTVPKTTPSSRI